MIAMGENFIEPPCHGQPRADFCKGERTEYADDTASYPCHVEHSGRACFTGNNCGCFENTYPDDQANDNHGKIEHA